MDHGGAWTIGVTILQRDDNETLDVRVFNFRLASIALLIWVGSASCATNLFRSILHLFAYFFQRLKNLENEFGRSQLSPPRSFDVTSDIKINVNETSQGFGVLGQTSHVRTPSSIG